MASADSILRRLQALTLCWRTSQLMHSYEVKRVARLLSGLSKVLGGVRLETALQLTGSAHWHFLKATLCQPQRTASTPRDHAMFLLCQLQPANSTRVMVSVAPSGCLGIQTWTVSEFFNADDWYECRLLYVSCRQ